MDIDSKAKVEQEARGDRGFTIIQVVVTLTLIAIISSFGIMAIGSVRASLRLNGAAREVAGYLEKARSNAIRRNSTTDSPTVTIVNATTYTVTMDFDGDGTVETRTITLPGGITFDSGSLGASAVFDWRGRVPNQVGIMLVNDRNTDTRSIHLSGSGDVTLEGEIFQDGAIGDITLNSDPPPAVASPTPGSSPSGSPGASPTATPTPNPDATPTPYPTATPTPTPQPTATPTPQPTATPTPTATPVASPTPIPCSITAPSTLHFVKNESPKTFTVTVANGSSTVITASKTGELTAVSPASTTVTGAGTILYTVTYPNGTNNGGTISISSPCGNKSIPVTIN